MLNATGLQYFFIDYEIRMYAQMSVFVNTEKQVGNALWTCVRPPLREAEVSC